MQLRSGKIINFDTKFVTIKPKPIYKDISVLTKYIKDKGGTTDLKNIIKAIREGGTLFNMLDCPSRVLGLALKYNFVKKNKDVITLCNYTDVTSYCNLYHKTNL